MDSRFTRTTGRVGREAPVLTARFEAWTALDWAIASYATYVAVVAVVFRETVARWPFLLVAHAGARHGPPAHASPRLDHAREYPAAGWPQAGHDLGMWYHHAFDVLAGLTVAAVAAAAGYLLTRRVPSERTADLPPATHTV